MNKNSIQNFRSVWLLAGGFALGIIFTTSIAAKYEDEPPADRFRLSGTQNMMYLVDTATGRVWSQSHSKFYSLKLGE